MEDLPRLVCELTPPPLSAIQWSQQLNLPLTSEAPDQGFYLVYDAQGLGLSRAGDSAHPLRIDLLNGALAHRLHQGGGAGQAVAKACGLKPGIRPSIFDATTGLATDALILASLGCSLVAAERHPWVAALVTDALQRASQLDWVSNLQLVHAEAAQWMRDWPASGRPVPQVVYLDPMFPETRQTAQVKKGMAYFRDLIGQDQDADALLPLALTLASHRVVVKRPKKAPYLNQQAPSFSLQGQANRFDVYALKKLSADD